MTPEEDRLLKEALKLPPEARAALAGSRLDSLDGDPDPAAEAEWEAEITALARALDSGNTNAVPWAGARRAISGD